MLYVYISRKLSGIIFLVFLALVLLGVIALAWTGTVLPLLVQVAGWLVIAIMIWGIVAGLGQLWRPALMYSADRRGVMIYYDAERIRFSARGVFLPWTLVSNLHLEERSVAGDSKKTWVIVCTLNGRAPFPVAAHSAAYDPQDGEEVVCLDAYVGNLSGEKFLDRLRLLWQAQTGRD